MKKFRITFKTKSKYHSTTRTVEVQTKDKETAINVVHKEFGSFKVKKISFVPITIPTNEPSNKIEIITCQELDENGDIKVVAEEVAV